MTRSEKKYCLSFIGVASTSGLLIWATKTFFELEGPFGPQQNPSLVYWKWAHYFSAPLVLWLIGFLWKDHISRGLKKNVSNRKMKQGLFLLGLSALVAFSGQSLLGISDQVWLKYGRWLHLGLGSSFTLFFIYHQRRN